MAVWSVPGTRLERWMLARIATRGSRRRLLALVALGTATISLALCAATYLAIGLRPSGVAVVLAAYGLPFVLPLVISPLLVSQLLRLTTNLRERSQELEAEVRRRRRAEARLAVLVTTDELTQVANRRAFFARAAEIANGTGATSTVAVLDLDDFKRVNDTLGHAAGDQVLRGCGTILRTLPDRSWVAARLGGEEFGLIMAGRPPDELEAFLDELRVRFSRVGHAMTVSIGASPWEAGEAIDVALARADAALYRAKQRGRNRVEFAGVHDAQFGTELAPVARTVIP